jgi:hypothetical protein
LTTSNELVTLHFVFEPNHASPDKVFVEAETEDGYSVRVGEWIPDPYVKGYEVLKLRVAAEDIHNLRELPGHP